MLKVPGISEPPKLPMSGLRSLVVTKHPDAAPLAKSDSTGRLELDGLRLPGRLVDGHAQAGASCLVWQPLGSDTASALKPGVSGRIIYREPPPPVAAAGARRRIRAWRVIVAPQPAQPPGVGGMVMQVCPGAGRTRRPKRHRPRKSAARSTSAMATSSPRSSPRSTPTASGSRPACRRARSWRMPRSRPSSWRPSRRTAPTRSSLTKSKKDRLLTLPRMQKADPPTHLIRSKNGDYLRGRVVEDGRQDARGRGPARKQGGAARPDLPDHLAARRRAR